MRAGSNDWIGSVLRLVVHRLDRPRWCRLAGLRLGMPGSFKYLEDVSSGHPTLDHLLRKGCLLLGLTKLSPLDEGHGSHGGEAADQDEDDQRHPVATRLQAQIHEPLHEL